MKTGFVSVDKNKDLFLDYIEGDFSSQFRALPMPSFNFDNPSDQVTFNLVNKNEIKKPHFLILISALLRLEWLGLSFAPVLLVSFYSFSQGQPVAVGSLMQTLFCVLCFHMSAFLYNDYIDYLKGADRIQHRAKAIQKGWVTAKLVRQLSYVFMAIGIASGFSIFWSSDGFVKVFSMVCLLCIFLYSQSRFDLKSKGLGELTVLLCFGPLMSLGVGLYWGISHLVDLVTVISLGVLLGVAAMICLQLKQLENILSDGLAKNKTLSLRLGFDGAKKLNLSFLILHMILMTVFWVRFFPLWYLLLLIPYGVIWWKLKTYLRLTHSPVSSSLLHTSRYAIGLHLITGLCLLLGQVLVLI